MVHFLKFKSQHCHSPSISEAPDFISDFIPPLFRLYFSGTAVTAGQRRSYIDETDSKPNGVNSDLNGTLAASRAAADSLTDKPTAERTTSGSTTMSTGAIAGETREERIARLVLF